VVLRLPEPMLARADSIPSGAGWTFEPKLDGFCCLVCTQAGFRARSRRGWDMSQLLPEFRRSLPESVQLDGELVALGKEGRSDFHRLSSRVLHGRPGIALTLFVFDVLAVEGLSTAMQPYRSDGRCSRSSNSRASRCGSLRPSRTARRCSLPSASAASRESSRSGCATRTGLASEVG
jgi:hypothetical protein